jgi:hypothetical protein
MVGDSASRVRCLGTGQGESRVRERKDIGGAAHATEMFNGKRMAVSEAWMAPWRPARHGWWPGRGIQRREAGGEHGGEGRG